MAGVIVSGNGSIDPSTGLLRVAGTAVATGGGNAVITAVCVESLVIVGVGQGSVPADGNSYDWSAELPAVNGPWQTGASAVVTAVLADATGAQVAYGANPSVAVY